jgi:hypothetical protein
MIMSHVQPVTTYLRECLYLSDDGFDVLVGLWAASRHHGGTWGGGSSYTRQRCIGVSADAEGV